MHHPALPQPPDATPTVAATAAPPVALNAPLCPLCGQPNRCAVAASGSFDTPCWCSSTTLAADTAERLRQPGLAPGCVCPACAAGRSAAAAATGAR